ncbi:MAG: arylsulfatase [Phycisphaerae bacterium]
MSRDMDRRAFLKAIGVGAASLGMPRLLSASEKGTRPNIILLMADDMGFSDIGCYGGEIRTPNLDRLANRGIRFTQFYNNAKCSPTRASLLTGLYSQQVGEGAMGTCRHCVTIAEALKRCGYRTLMTGKWHQNNIPVRRGFDRYFGLADGCCNFWNPGKQREGEPPPGRKWARWRRWAIDDKEYTPYTPEKKDFYTTDAFTDYAVKYLDEYGKEDKPFFLYIAYTAPHYPLHAWPEDIAKYKGKYMCGWDKLREQRYARIVEMGLIDRKYAMSPRDDGVAKWEDVADKEEWDLKMAVYAAMIDRMDQNIGRIMDKVRQLGKEDNTLVLFLADNGGCAERVHKTPNIPPGALPSYRTVDPPWANASNTPFRKYKSWDHEGGIATPLIACWPARIGKGGRITHQVGHIIDIMATCLDAAGAEYPAAYNGEKILPLEGKSLLPIFDGKQRKGHDVLFWQFGRSRAVREGKWKLVSHGAKWELYDLAADRTELNDLSSAEPQRVEKMAAMYKAWEARCRAARKKGKAG